MPPWPTWFHPCCVPRYQEAKTIAIAMRMPPASAAGRGRSVCGKLSGWGASDEIVSAIAVSEPDAGSDVAAIRTRADDDFGEAVAIKGDTLVVGASRDDEASVGGGAAFVYERTAGVFALATKLLPTVVDPQERFGTSVDVSGTAIVVGAPFEDQGGFVDRGAAYVYRRGASAWTLEQKLSEGEAFVRFGAAVTIDGDMIVVGAPQLVRLDARANGGYPFMLMAGTWVTGPLVYGPRNPTPTSECGASVELFSRFELAVGCPGGTVSSPGGVVLIREWFGLPEWFGPIEDVGREPIGMRFGASVAIIRPASRIESIVGVPGDYTRGTDAGRLTLVRPILQPVSEQASQFASAAAAGDRFGASVAASGLTMAVGAPGAGGGDGAVYVLEESDTDSDGLPTDWELKYGLNPTSSTPPNGGADDPDADGLSNKEEYVRDTDPFLPNATYFAEGALAPFTTEIAVANPTAYPATFVVRTVGAAGEDTATAPIDLAPQSRTTLNADLLGGGLSGRAITVSAVHGGVVAERTMTWTGGDGRAQGGHTGRGATTLSTEWRFAEGDASFATTYFLLLNPGPNEITVDATYFYDTGDRLTRRYYVGGARRVTILANLVPGAQGHSFGATFKSVAPFAVERSSYFPTRRNTAIGGMNTTGLGVQSQAQYFAEGRTGPAFDTFLLLANPGPTPSTVLVRCTRADHAVVSATFQLDPYGRQTVWLDTLAGLEDAEFATVVTGSAPFVAERAMYWFGSYPEWTDGHVSTGTTTPGTRLALAEGREGGPEHHTTYLLFANFLSTDAHVTLTFERTNSPALTAAMTIPANSRVSRAASEFGLANESFGTLIESTQPIVVERSMYWDADRHWGAGSSEVALRIR